jgi:type IX secretion system PorP/SprF family membrane protein
MKHYIIISLFLLAGTATHCQQLQTSSFYDMQGVLHNPSTAGVQTENMIGATYRTQWSGISGNPKTATVFGTFELPKQNMGVGAYLYNDRTGPTSRTGIQVSIAKHIPTGDGGKISFGIESRFQQFAINRGKLSQTLGDDPVLAGSDNQFKFDAGLGASYTGKKLQIGAAVSQLVQSKLNFYNGNLSPNEQARLYRHYYAHASYKWDVDGATTIIPNVLFIYLPNAPLEFQGGIRVEHNKLLWWGLGVRAKQNLMLSAGIHATKNLSIGYGYDFFNTPLSLFDNGSAAHEVIIRYRFSK